MVAAGYCLSGVLLNRSACLFGWGSLHFAEYTVVSWHRLFCLVEVMLRRSAFLDWLNIVLVTIASSQVGVHTTRARFGWRLFSHCVRHFEAEFFSCISSCVMEKIGSLGSVVNRKFDEDSELVGLLRNVGCVGMRVSSVRKLMN